MRTPLFTNTTVRAQELRAKLQKVAKKTLTFSLPDEEFRVDFAAPSLSGGTAAMEAQLWNPTREHELTLLDGSLLRVSHEGSLEWVDAGRSERHQFRSFASSLELPHGWASVRISRSHLEQIVCAPLFAVLPNRETEEQHGQAVAKRAAFTTAGLMLLLTASESFFSARESQVQDAQPVPEAYVKLLTTPVRVQRGTPQAPAVSREQAGAQAVQKSLNQAVQSKSLQKALSRFLSAPAPVLAARSPAGALPLTGASKKSAEVSQQLAQLSALAQAGPGVLGGTNTSGRLGPSGQANVAGQGKAFVSLRLEDARVEEGLTKDEVGEVIHRHAAEIRYCYEAAMLRQPDLEGKLAIAFTIGGQGSVLSSRVLQTSMGDPRVGDCVLAKLTSWRFPRPKGGIEVPVTYPFIFKSLGKG